VAGDVERGVGGGRGEVGVGGGCRVRRGEW